jgi:hypothetical protein
MMDESQAWGTFALDFFVAEGCDAVLVRVRRNLSTRLDNLLAGDLWLRGLKIEEASETSESHSALEILPVKKLP